MKLQDYLLLQSFIHLNIMKQVSQEPNPSYNCNMNVWRKNFIYYTSAIFTIRTHLLYVFFSRVTPRAYGSSQTRGGIRAAAACLHPSNARSMLSLPPMLQLVTTLDPEPTKQGQGSNPHHHGY